MSSRPHMPGLLVASLLVLATQAGCSGKVGEAEADKGKKVETSSRVKVGSPEVRTLHRRLEYTGTVEPVRQVRIVPEVTAKVVKLNVEMMDPLIMESFRVSTEESYEPGDVLVIDPQGSGTVCLSYKAQDTGIIGVVAPDATVDDRGEILITILGAQGPLRDDGTRLEGFVKADATYGAIQAGDLLTTSPTPGYAMKATEPKIGTILGKALEPLQDGQGLIRVFITLH